MPLAAMVPFALYSQWERRREGFFGQMGETANRAGLSEAKALRLADEATCAVRSRP